MRAHPHSIRNGKVRFEHLPESESHMGRFLLKEQVGWIDQPWMHNGAMLARLRMLTSCELADDLLHTYGLSMQVTAQVNRDAQKNPVSVHRIGAVESVDLTASPALAGRILGPWLGRADAEKWHRAERAMVRFEESCRATAEAERRQAMLRNYEQRLDAVVSRYERRLAAIAARM